MGTEYIPLPKKLGRPRKFKSPDELWELAQQYFAYSEANKWESGELIKSGDLAGVVVKVMKRVPFTWAGFCVYLIRREIAADLDEYKSNRRGEYDDFADVIKQINFVMYHNKFEGATIGDFNPNIIARDLGLAEKTIAEVKDTTDEIDYDSLSDSALEEIMNAKRKNKNG